MDLIHLEGTGLYDDRCLYCIKSCLVFIWCTEELIFSLGVVSRAREKAVVLSKCGVWAGVSK